jgi:hypothetical protein
MERSESNPKVKINSLEYAAAFSHSMAQPSVSRCFQQATFLPTVVPVVCWKG